MTSMYDQVLQLPIFQGISRDQLTAILEKVHFHFTKYKGGDEIVAAGRDFSEVLFLLSGEIRVETSHLNTRIRVSQHFHAPHTLSFYHLFGADIHHQESIYATGDVGIMSMSKADFLLALRGNEILLINVLNILSSRAQHQGKNMELYTGLDDTARMACWLLNYTARKAYDITVRATPADWAQVLLVDQKNFWKALSVLEKNRFVEMQEDRLKLLDRYALKLFVNEKMSIK